jgi:hypothetical protein
VSDMIDLDDIPALRGPRPEGASKVRRRVPAEGPSAQLARRSLLSGLVAAGGTMGLTALGAFPPARQAIEGGYRLVGYYDIYPRCPSYASSHNCSPGCGPSLVCSTCCQTKGYRRGYHKSKYLYPGYMLRPNQCYAGKYDGWTWAYAHPCGRCKKSVTWRCHDGWKKSSHGSYYKTICRWATSCRS